VNPNTLILVRDRTTGAANILPLRILEQTMPEWPGLLDQIRHLPPGHGFVDELGGGGTFFMHWSTS
jgi:hypothetical protein